MADRPPHFDRTAPLIHHRRQKCRRHHADDGVRRIVEQDLPADRRGIAPKTPCEESVAQDHHVVPARLVILRRKIAPERRPHAQESEIIRAHLFGDEPLWHAINRARRHPDVSPCHVCKDLVLRPPIHKICVHAVGVVELARAAIRILDCNQPIGLHIGERTQKHRAHHAEDRCVHPDAQRRRKDR